MFPPYFIRPSLARTFAGMLVPLRCNGRLPCGIVVSLLLTQAPDALPLDPPCPLSPARTLWKGSVLCTLSFIASYFVL